MNTICLVIDRLHAGYLGAYGNSWIETPSIDRLAGQSFLFDQAHIDSPRLESICRSYWQGWHCLCPSPPADRPSLPGLLREAGIVSTLLSDDRLVHQHPLAVEFDDVIAIDPPWQTETAVADDIEETHLARSFAQIIDWLESVPQPFFLWCHLGSLGMTWDVPWSFRQTYVEEDDPAPSRSAEVPDRMLAVDHDPDAVLGDVQAYAGQVSLLDLCIGGLCEVLDEHPAGRDTLLALTSPRGFPLGEHRRVGPCDEALHVELVHVPLMLRFPDGLGATARSQTLAEPADLYCTLLDHWRVPELPRSPSGLSLMPVVRDEVAAVRDRLVIAGPGAARGIRTPGWYLRLAAAPELYAKPDDRWEANDVSTRCQDVAESLRDAAVEYDQAIQCGSIADLPPLAPHLLEGAP